MVIDSVFATKKKTDMTQEEENIQAVVNYYKPPKYVTDLKVYEQLGLATGTDLETGRTRYLSFKNYRLMNDVRVDNKPLYELV